MKVVIYLCLLFAANVFVSAVNSGVKVKQNSKNAHVRPNQGYDFTGCPTNNDFWTQGIITSPFWPSKYPNNVKCWYYMQAEIGNVLKFNFTDFEVEACCDSVTIYDGYGDAQPILVQFGGPNRTADYPTGVFYSSTRYALMTFTTDLVQAEKGFRLQYSSAFTSTPCNRDILLVINGLSSLGSQTNFLKELDFIANYLISNWTIGPQQTRVFLSLQVDIDFAIVYPFDYVPTLDILRQTILALTRDAPDVMQNNGTDFESLFRYGTDNTDSDTTFVHREGIEQIEIVFVAQNPLDDQDFYEATEFAHQSRDRYDTKLITIAMGQNIDVKKVGTLSYGEGFYFGADYPNLPSIAADVNKAICKSRVKGCGV
jgi:hypothetical protein